MGFIQTAKVRFELKKKELENDGQSTGIFSMMKWAWGVLYMDWFLHGCLFILWGCTEPHTDWWRPFFLQ